MIRIQFRLTILVVCGLCLAGRACAQPWVLVWSDEFSQADGTSPDPAKWGFDTGGNGFGNHELESYTSRTNNARIVNGQLVIEARQENYTGADGIARNYTSARLKTKGKWSWTLGRIEARIQVPRGQGLWPAFWTLGANIDSVNWPTCGEIDIMENIGREPGTIHGTIHGPGYSGANGIGGPYVFPNGMNVADAFHTFAIEWETNAIRWYVDNQLYFTVSPASLPGGTTWVFNLPQFLLLNVAVGGDWPGNPDGTTTFPQRMLVDYVRVYARTNLTGAGANILTNPGFELGGLAGWTRYGANTYLQNVATFPVHGGSNVFKVFGQFTGGDNYSGLYQDNASYPGASYTADAWVQSQASDRIAGGNTGWVEVSFRNAASTNLAVYRTGIFDSTTPAGVWLNLPVTNQLNPSTLAVIGTATNLVAPAGTATVHYQLVFHQPLSAGGSLLFDDLTLAQTSGAVPPTLGNFVPDGSVPFVSPTNRLGFTAVSPSGIASNGFQVLLNGADITPLLVISGPATNRSVKFSGLVSNKTYSAWAQATDTNGLSATASWQFDTFSQNNFMWEAEDFDFGGGQFLDHPIPSSTAKTNSYFGRVGQQNTDENETSFDGARLYRAADPVATLAATDFTRQRFLDAIAGGDTNVLDYKVGYYDAGEWLNYTRTFPVGTFYVYGRLAGGAGAAEVFLDRVIAGQGTTNQTTIRLGSFQFSGRGWQSYDFVPLRDTNGLQVSLSLGGVATLRATTTGGADMNHFMLVPARTPVSVSAVKNGADIILSFASQAGLTYLVLFTTDLVPGNWQTLASVTGDGTLKSVADPASANSRFYQVVAQ